MTCFIQLGLIWFKTVYHKHTYKEILCILFTITEFLKEGKFLWMFQFWLHLWETETFGWWVASCNAVPASVRGAPPKLALVLVKSSSAPQLTVVTWDRRRIIGCVWLRRLDPADWTGLTFSSGLSRWHSIGHFTPRGFIIRTTDTQADRLACRIF